MLSKAMVEVSQEMCHGRCMFILEGGYDQASLADAVCSSFTGILGEGVLGDNDAAKLLEEPLEKVQGVLKEVVKYRRHCQ